MDGIISKFIGSAAVREAIGGNPAARVMVRKLLKHILAPAIEAAIDVGFDKPFFQELVEEEESFWDSVCLPQWKRKVAERVNEDSDLAQLLEETQGNPQAISLVMEVLAEFRDFFPHVIPPWYLEREFERVVQALRSYRTPVH